MILMITARWDLDAQRFSRRPRHVSAVNCHRTRLSTHLPKPAQSFALARPILPQPCLQVANSWHFRHVWRVNQGWGSLWYALWESLGHINSGVHGREFPERCIHAAEPLAAVSLRERPQARQPRHHVQLWHLNLVRTQIADLIEVAIRCRVAAVLRLLFGLLVARHKGVADRLEEVPDAVSHGVEEPDLSLRTAHPIIIMVSTLDIAWEEQVDTRADTSALPSFSLPRSLPFPLPSAPDPGCLV
eukprot:3846516-Rhodomonas_salina.5